MINLSKEWSSLWNKKYKNEFFTEQVNDELKKLSNKYHELNAYQSEKIIPKINSECLKNVLETLTWLGIESCKGVKLSYHKIKEKLEEFSDQLNELKKEDYFIDKTISDSKITRSELFKPLDELLHDFNKKYREMDDYQLEVAFPKLNGTSTLQCFLDDLNWIGIEMCKGSYSLYSEIIKKRESMIWNLDNLKDIGFFKDEPPKGFKHLAETRGIEIAKKVYG